MRPGNFLRNAMNSCAKIFFQRRAPENFTAVKFIYIVVKTDSSESEIEEALRYKRLITVPPGYNVEISITLLSSTDFKGQTSTHLYLMVSLAFYYKTTLTASSITYISILKLNFCPQTVTSKPVPSGPRPNFSLLGLDCASLSGPKSVWPCFDCRAVGYSIRIGSVFY